MPVDTRSCTKIKIDKKECCYKTTTETINQDQDINLVSFPALAKAGDTHIVEFNDSLAVYEFTTEWGLTINHVGVNIVEVPSIAFTNPLEPTTFELATWIDDNLTLSQKKFSYLTYNYGDTRLTTLTGQVYLVKDSELTKIRESNSFRNGTTITLNIDLIGGLDTRELHEYEDGASYLTLDKALSDFTKYFDDYFVNFKIANSSLINQARITSSAYIYNKFISFSPLIPNTSFYVSIEAWTSLRNSTFTFSSYGIFSFTGAGEIFSWDSLVYAFTVGTKINLPDTEGRVAIKLYGGGMTLGDTWGNPSTLATEIIYRANETDLVSCYSGEAYLSIHGVIFTNPSFTNCRLVSEEASNGGGQTGTVNISVGSDGLSSINSVSNIHWGGQTFVKIADFYQGTAPACFFFTSRDQLLPLNQWSASCVGGRKKIYKTLLTQTSINAPIAVVLENSLGGTVVWTRISAGVYQGVLTGAFTSTVIAKSSNSNPNIAVSKLDNNTIQVLTIVTDGILNDDWIEIEVYF